MMEPKEMLSESLEEVHAQRAALEIVKLLITELEGVIDKTSAGMELIRLRNLKVNTTAALNNRLIEAKRLAQDVAVELNDKKPHPGVLIKAKTTVTITDKEAAIEYVKQVYPTLVTYDEKAFMKILKALPDEVLPRWVSRVTDDYATPTIVKDLGKFFEEEKETFDAPF